VLRRFYWQLLAGLLIKMQVSCTSLKSCVIVEGFADCSKSSRS